MRCHDIVHPSPPSFLYHTATPPPLFVNAIASRTEEERFERAMLLARRVAGAAMRSAPWQRRAAICSPPTIASVCRWLIRCACRHREALPPIDETETAPAPQQSRWHVSHMRQRQRMPSFLFFLSSPLLLLPFSHIGAVSSMHDFSVNPHRVTAKEDRKKTAGVGRGQPSSRTRQVNAISAHARREILFTIPFAISRRLFSMLPCQMPLSAVIAMADSAMLRKRPADAIASATRCCRQLMRAVSPFVLILPPSALPPLCRCHC